LIGQKLNALIAERDHHAPDPPPPITDPRLGVTRVHPPPFFSRTTSHATHTSHPPYRFLRVLTSLQGTSVLCLRTFSTECTVEQIRRGDLLTLAEGSE
jgi:hypothetical protein